MNTKKGIYNIASGLATQLISMALGLIVPRLFLLSFGSGVNGMLVSISQIFQYFALLEAGVGLAALQALYGPVARDDTKSINQIMAATDKYYKRTGLMYFAAVLFFSALFPMFTDTPISFGEVTLVILLQGMGNVVSYLFQGKFRILLQAEGKNYILSNLATVINILTNVSKIALIMLGFNVIAIQVAFFLLSLSQMLYIMFYIRRHYPWINLKVEPDLKSVAQKDYVLLHQISGLVFSSTDAIILGQFCGFNVVSIWSVYTMLTAIVLGVMDTVCNGIRFHLGQKFNTDMKRFTVLQDTFETYYIALTFILYTALYLFIIPFVRLYTHGVEDISYVDPLLPPLMILNTLLTSGRLASNQVINFAGEFKNTKNSSLIETGINLVVSLVLVQFIGIYGVLLGTIFALLYRANYMISYANKKILKRSPKATYRRLFINFGIFLVSIICFTGIFYNLDSYLKIVLWGGLSLIVLSCVYLAVNSFFEPEAYGLAKRKLLSVFNLRKA